MVIKGACRGNGKQLAAYLLSMSENENVRILDVDGKQHADKEDLHASLLQWSLMSELTNSDKGLYHAQINPAYGRDKQMTPEQWEQCADILAKQLGYEDQGRAIVLHEKKGRTHAHVVFQRYDLEKGIMKSDSLNYLKHDKARAIMEQTLGHERTANRNIKQPDIKKELSDLWRQHRSGKDFIKAAQDKGYKITEGYTTSGGKTRPFGVVDKTGRAFDLARQLDKDIKTKDVRQKLEGEKLPTEKEAIRETRSQQTDQNLNRTQEQAGDRQQRFQYQQKVNEQEKRSYTYTYKAQEYKQQADQATAKEQPQDKATDQQQGQSQASDQTQQARAERMEDMKQTGQQATETEREKRLREFNEQWYKADQQKAQSQEQSNAQEPPKNETEQEKALREFNQQWNRPKLDLEKDFGLEIEPEL